MNNRAVGIKRRGRARGNSHLSSGAERRKGEGRRQSRGKSDQINVARRKDGDGQTDGNADVYPRTVGRGRRPQSRRAAGNGAGQRHAGGEAKIKPRRAVSYSRQWSGAKRPDIGGRPSPQGKIEKKNYDKGIKD